MLALKVGADPELFLKHNGAFVSGFNIIPGTKVTPFAVDRGAVQVDGMALEFNITPANNVKQWEKNINTVLAQLRAMIDPKYDMVLAATADFPAEYVAAQPEEARLLGCQPDYNAYTKRQNTPPEQHPTMRTAAGHVHLGWKEGADPLSASHFDSCVKLAIQLDYALGLPALIIDPDRRRKQMYGQPGAFRPKPYGMEYRAISNYWLVSQNLIQSVYFNTVKAFDALKEGFCYEDVAKKNYNLSARKAIEEDDIETAAFLCRQFNFAVRKP